MKGCLSCLVNPFSEQHGTRQNVVLSRTHPQAIKGARQILKTVILKLTYLDCQSAQNKGFYKKQGGQRAIISGTLEVQVDSRPGTALAGEVDKSQSIKALQTLRQALEFNSSNHVHA